MAIATVPNPTPIMRTRPLCRDHGGDPRALELAASLEEHQIAISTHEAAMLSEIAEFDRAESWRGDGALSMDAWLQARLRVSPARARTLVAAAAKVGELPRLCDAFSAGRLTLDVLAHLAAVATSATDGELASSCGDLTVRQARDLRAAGAGASDAAHQYSRRHVRFNDARCTLTAQLPAERYAALKARLMRQARRHDHPSSSAEGYEPLECRVADALYDLVVATPGAASAPSTEHFGRARPTVVVHVDLAVLTGDVPGHAYIPGIGPLSAEVARRLSCDAVRQLSIDGPSGNCLDLKPLRRDPTTAQRLEIARRDNCQCRFPGCHITAITDVHHMHEFDKGGPTVLSNLITLCAGHHSRVHELGWSMRGNANETVTFTSPHGHQSRSVPSPVWRRALPQRK